MMFNLLSRFILWLKKIFHKPLVEVLPEGKISEVPQLPEEKTPEVPPTEHPEVKAKTKTRKPYKKRAPTEERKKEHRKSSEEDEKPATPKRRKEIDLGAKRKIPKPTKQRQQVAEERTEKTEKEFGREETPTRIESPFIEIDLDEAKVFLIIPKQQFKPSTASNISQQLHYKLELNGEEQPISLKVSENEQGIAKVEEKRIELEKPLKNFQVVFPDELQGRLYSYKHSNGILYAFVAIGNNRGRMYYLYDEYGKINPLPKRDVWILLNEDFELESEPDIIEESWIWEKHRPFRVNLKEMNELVIKNTKTSKEYKLSCKPTFLIEGQVIEDDFKDQMPLLIGETLKIKAPRENPSGWTVWIQNKIVGYRIITENWDGVEPLILKLPDDMPCECGEFQMDICEQEGGVPIETLFFRYMPSLRLEYNKELIVPDTYQGHNPGIIKVILENNFQDWELKTPEKMDSMTNGYQIELPPEKDILRFSVTKRGKPETGVRLQVTIPRLKWRTSKQKTWNDKPLQIERDVLVTAMDFYLSACTNDFDTKYGLLAILKVNDQKLQEVKFVRKGRIFNLLLNQFYDLIKSRNDELILNLEVYIGDRLIGNTDCIVFQLKPQIIDFEIDQNLIEKEGKFHCKFKLTCYENSILDIVCLDNQGQSIINEKNKKIEGRYMNEDISIDIPLVNIEKGKYLLKIFLNHREVYEHEFYLQKGYKLVELGGEFDINTFLEKFNNQEKESEKLDYLKRVCNAKKDNLFEILIGLIGQRKGEECIRLLSKDIYEIIPSDFNLQHKAFLLILLNFHFWGEERYLNGFKEVICDSSTPFNELKNGRIWLYRFLVRDLFDILNQTIEDILHIPPCETFPLERILTTEEQELWEKNKEKLIRDYIKEFLKYKEVIIIESTNIQKLITILTYCSKYYDEIINYLNMRDNYDNRPV